MQDLNDKVTGGTLTAAEWNEVPSEIQSTIVSAGIALSGGDLQQQVKAIAAYASVGEFFTGGGAADAYTIAVPSPRIAPAALLDGMKFRAIFGATNTGASTLNPFGLGVTDIKLKGGITDPSAGDIASGEEATLIYRTSPGAHFELQLADAGVSAGVLLNIQVITATGTFTPTAGASKFHIFVTGGGAGSGGANAADADSEAIGGSSGAGGTAETLYDLVELGANAAVSIGGAGTGGAAGANDGSAGGATTFTPAGTGAVLTGNGGVQGLGVSTTTFSEGGAGAGGTATGGLINHSGGSGNAGNGGGDNVKFLLSGPGGASYWGQGGNSQNLTGTGTTDGAAGVNYGSGASGGIEINSTAAAGADGADGVVVVYEYA